MLPAVAAAAVRGKAAEMAAGALSNDYPRRIGNLVAGIMIVVAVLFDLTQFLVTFLVVIPVVGTALGLVVPIIISMFAFLIFGIWFKLQGTEFFDGKKALTKTLTAMGGALAELLPLVEAIPAITGSVILLIIQTRLEDYEKAKEKAEAAAAQTQAYERLAAQQAANDNAEQEAAQAA